MRLKKWLFFLSFLATYLEVVGNVVIAAARLGKQARIVRRRRRRLSCGAAVRGRCVGVVVVGLLLSGGLVFRGGRHGVFFSSRVRSLHFFLREILS